MADNAGDKKNRQVPYIKLSRNDNFIVRDVQNCIFTDYAVIPSYVINLQTTRIMQDILVRIRTGYGKDRRVAIRGRDETLYATAFRPAVGPTQPPIHCVPGALPLEEKRPGYETDYLHTGPRSRMVELYLYSFIRLQSVVKVVPMFN
jgi:hypothetical protein